MESRKRFMFIDDPNPYDTLENLERALIEYEALPEDVLMRDDIIEDTKRLIARGRNGLSSSDQSETLEHAVKEFQEFMKNEQVRNSS